jgi:hypothetical protein
MSRNKQSMYDDLFFAPVFVVFGLIQFKANWVESDWGGIIGWSIALMFGGLWLFARIYHVTHQEEVFGPEEVDSEQESR